MIYIISIILCRCHRVNNVSYQEVLLYTTNFSATLKEIDSIDGKIPMRLGDDLVVAKIPQDRVNTHLTTASSTLSCLSQENFRYIKAFERSKEIAKWNDRSSHIDISSIRGNPNLQQASSNKSNSSGPTMTGTIASVIFIVSGPDSRELSEDEISKSAAGATSGIKFWVDKAFNNSVGLSIVNFVWNVTSNLTEYPLCVKFHCYDCFVLPALAAHGYKSISDLQSGIKRKYNFKTVMVTFINKYWVGAAPVLPNIDIDFSNHVLYLRIVPGAISRFHLYIAFYMAMFHGAQFEGSSTCNCHDLYGNGTCQAPNGNCRTCTSHQVPCIMSQNHNWGELCPYTRKHIGWCSN